MSKETNHDISDYRDDEREIAAGFSRLAYDSLLSLARTRRRRAGFRDTMMTDDLLQETFLKLSGKTAFESPDHFVRTASLAMRQVVVDHARRKLSDKRGGGEANLTYDEGTTVLPEFSETPEQIVILNDLLKRLETEHPRLARIVDARYFAGMTEVEVAASLGLSERTVRRDWQAARAWLAQHMGTAG